MDSDIVAILNLMDPDWESGQNCDEDDNDSGDDGGGGGGGGSGCFVGTLP